MILAAYVMPHPPIILPEVGRGEERKIVRTSQALERAAKEIAELRPDTIIISSPHAPAYADAFFIAAGDQAKGDLSQFGISPHDLSIEIAYDEELASVLADSYQRAPLVSPLRESRELDHGSLIPLRFIQKEYTDFKVLRLGISGFSSREHYRLGEAVAEACEQLDRRVVFIASGDLSHVLKADGPYGYKEAGPIFDSRLLEILERGDFSELLAFPEDLIEAAAQCGICSFQIMAGALSNQAFKAEKYSYEGTFGVGYAVIAYRLAGRLSEAPMREKKADGEGSWRLPNHGSDDYIELAKAVIAAYLKDGSLLPIPADLPAEMLNNKAGAFVSLHRHGNLRGCIGTIAPTCDSIAEEIRQNAISAATRDPRFNPMVLAEISDLELSVDVLQPAEAILSSAELDPRRYGVIVSSGYRRGLLLPNLEGVDTIEEQVSIALQKAGISPSESYSLERFEVVRHEY